MAEKAAATSSNGVDTTNGTTPSNGHGATGLAHSLMHNLKRQQSDDTDIDDYFVYMSL